MCPSGLHAELVCFKEKDSAKITAGEETPNLKTEKKKKKKKKNKQNVQASNAMNDDELKGTANNSTDSTAVGISCINNRN